jgi:hypothetical protein
LRKCFSGLLVTVALLSACIGNVHAAGAPGDSTALLPPVGQYQLTLEPTVYDASNLWMFIDGAAELFLTYGFVDLHVGYYRKDNGNEIRVEVYHHSSCENAFGMYSQERSAESKFLKLGVQGYAEDGLVTFLAGPYYVKLTSNVADSALGVAMLDVAHAIEALLHQPTTWPAALGLLPVPGREENTEQFVAQDYLGYGFLGDAYVARYHDRCSFEVFVIPTAIADGARGIAEKLAGANHLSLAPGRRQVLRDLHQGEVGLFIGDRALFGIVHCEDPDVRTKFLEILQSSIK